MIKSNESLIKVVEKIRKDFQTNITDDQKSETFDFIESAVSDILKETRSKAPVEIINLCSRLGFFVFKQELDENMFGYIAIDSELERRLGTDRLISVNTFKDSARRRFTVAYELGHYLFDFGPDSYEFHHASRNEDLSDWKEVRAGRFADALLMPADSFRAEYEKAQQTYAQSSERAYKIIQSLSYKFLVPTDAVKRRLDEIQQRTKL